MPQEHLTDNPILDAAKRELAERYQTTAPLRTASNAYEGPARIVSINTSAHKGTRKSPVSDGHDTVIEQFGLASDAHAGHWHRQVSFLAAESIQTARHRGLDVHEGDFGENFTTQGINLLSLPWAHSSRSATTFWSRSARSARSATPAVPSTISPVTVSFPTRAFSVWCFEAERCMSETISKQSSSATARVPSPQPRRSKKLSRLAAREPYRCKTPCWSSPYGVNLRSDRVP